MKEIILKPYEDGNSRCDIKDITQIKQNLENKKKVLEFDLEGIQLSIQKEEKEKFETKIVLENLKYFSKKIGETAPTERPQLFQSLIKSVSYGSSEISLDIFFLPERYIQGFGNHRAYSAGRAWGGKFGVGCRWEWEFEKTFKIPAHSVKTSFLDEWLNS
jgi:hypothetical protein